MLSTAAICCLMLAGSVSAVTVEKLISREVPDMRVTGDSLTLGRDGRVYMARGSYIMRFDADGSNKTGGKAGRANDAAAVNKDGVIAVASAHMSMSVRMLTPQFEEFASIREFLGNDQLGWNSPCDMQTGPSGEFYAPDQHRERIVRISANGKVLGKHSIECLNEDFTGKKVRFRVVESLKRFYVATQDGQIHAVTFDGQKEWSIQSRIGGDPYGGGYDGDFNADDEGNIYILRNNSDTIEILGPDGKSTGKTIKLAMADLNCDDVRFQLNDQKVYVKRDHKTEMFQIYDRKTGKFERAIHGDVEYARLDYASEVWTAGKPVDFKLTLESPKRTITALWSVRMARYNDYEWFSVPVVNGKVTPPADAGGLYVFQTGYNEFAMEGIVEIRQPGSRGTLNILTPQNRVYYGRGENIPLTVIVRGGQAADVAKVALSLKDRKTGQEVLKIEHAGIKWAGQTGTASIPAATSLKLRAGSYMLTASVGGLTTVPQPLVMGNGLRNKPAFHVVQGGDGATPLAEPSLLGGPADIVVQTERNLRLGANLILDRIGGDIDITQPPLGSKQLAERLKKDPIGVAPEKAMVENTNLHAIAARGAVGIEQQGILFHMDTNIPMLPEGDNTPGGKLARYPSDLRVMSR